MYCNSHPDQMLIVVANNRSACPACDEIIINSKSQMKAISEAILDSEGGSFLEIMIKARQLKDLENIQELVKKREEVLDCIDAFKVSLEDCGIYL